jgi:hypothetical protein
MSKAKKRKLRTSKFLRDQDKLRLQRKLERMAKYAETKRFAESNPTPKLHKSVRMRFRNRVQLLEGTLDDRHLKKFGLLESVTVRQEAVEAFQKDELIQAAITRRAQNND